MIDNEQLVNQHKYTFRILYFNSNSILGKLDVIKAQVDTYKPDIVCITETKVDSSFDDNELLGDNYTVYRNDRIRGGGGVLAAFCNKSPISMMKSSKGPGESLVSTISLSPQITFDLITYYRPPSEAHLDTLHSIFNDRSSKYPLVALGDFNLPDIDWSNGVGKVRDSSKRHLFHQEALDMFDTFNMAQLVHGPTHKKGNTLDLIFIETVLFDSLKFDCSILPGLSDHEMILLETSVTNLPSAHLKHTQDPSRILYNFKKANFEEIGGLFSNLFQQINKDSCLAETKWELFKSTTLFSLKNYVPTLLPRPGGRPWMTRSLLRTIRRRDRAYKTSKQYPTMQNVLNLDTLKKSVKIEVNKAKTSFIECHITREMHNGNTKPLFNLISKSRGQSNHIGCLENTLPEHIADTFAEFFSTVFNDNTHPIPDFTLQDPPSHSMPGILITEEGVTALIKNLDMRKSTGPDGISSYCLREFSSSIPGFLQCLTTIMQASLDQGSMPEDWRLASVVPIFKSGRRDLPHNYRPISLTSITSKMIEHIIVSSMWQHIDKYNLINNNQHGFRKRFSTTTQLLDVIHQATKALAEQQTYHLVSFDFAKAFDKVPHHLLIHKIKSYKFDVKVINWIEIWLSDRNARVEVNNTRSQTFKITSGVPQGSVLGPLLFLLFINDIPLCVNSSSCRLYADDTLLGMDITHSGESSLQNNVNALYEWSLKWGMTFNASKCVHMQLGKDRPSFTLYMNGSAIPQSNSVKYLGVYIQSDLKWHHHTLEITKKSNKALGLITRCLFNASSDTKMISFNTIVRPILEYASPVWSPYNKGLIAKLETVQRRAVKWAYRLATLESITNCMEENSIAQLADRRKELDEKFIKKIEFGLYDVNINDYVSFNNSHFTRHGAINPHYRLDQFKYSFYNRMSSSLCGHNFGTF